MNRFKGLNVAIRYQLVAVLTILLFSCKKPTDDLQLPGYLRIPASLDGYVGSGLFSLDGDVSLHAEGDEKLDRGLPTFVRYVSPK